MINRLYYKSDFKSEVTLPSSIVGRPFRFTYTTSGARSLELKRFVAYRDADGHCENCTVVPREVMQPDGSLITEERVVVNFDNHGLRPGNLRTERKYFLADENFTLEGFNPAKLRELDLELTTHADDTLDLMLIEQEPKDEELLMILRGKDAYETAVASGYTGTREQWLQDGFGVDVMATATRIASENVSNIYQAADFAKLRATTEINQVASEAESAINETAETAKSDVSAVVASAKEEITSTATTAKEEVSSVATTAKEEVTAVATTAKNQIGSEAATATSEINNAKQTAIAAVEQSASSATSSIEAAQHAIDANKQALDTNTEAILTARDNAQDAAANASDSASFAAGSATASAQSASDSAQSASDSANSAEAAATSAQSASDSASSATSTLSTVQAEHSAIDATLADVASQGESAAIAAVSAQVAQNKEGLNDLALNLSELKSILRMISQDGFAVPDKDGNVGMKYDENGLDAAKLSSHLIALIQAVVKVSSSLIAEIEQGVWTVTDGDGYAGMTYGEDGLDFAKISQHAIDVLNEAGIASKIALDNYVTADGQNAVVGSAIFSAISAVTAVANEAVTLSEQAKTDAKNAKDAIATLQGLSDATEAARTLAALTSQIQQNTQDVNALKTADANLGVIGQYCQEQVYLMKYALNSTRLGNNRFSFVYTADNHSGFIGYADVVADNTAAKCVVIGGDMLGGYWGSDATGRQKDWKKTKDQILAMTKPCFYAMGNHDVTGSTNIAERYNFFYNDSEINAHNGVSPLHTYFNVDYPTVKLIILDFYDVENQSSVTLGMSKGQIDWFIAQLKDAASKNLHVVCVAHHSPDESTYTYKNLKYCEYVKSWTDGNGSSVKELSILSSLVESFKGASSYNLTYDGNTFSGTFSNAGHFVCWLGGHGHLDFLGWLTNYPEQIYYDSTRPGVGGSNTHLVEGKTNSSVCYITVDTNVQKVTFLKVGSDRDYFGTKRDIITLDYK